MNSSPALVALYGRIYNASPGALSLLKIGGLGTAMLAILAFMLVVRHTRAEEEAGRFELLGSTGVGRFAVLTAGLMIGIGTCVLIGLLSTVGLIASGLPVPGSVAFGLAWAATGCAFSAVGALAAQLTTGGRTASGIAAAFLGVAYMVRAVADASGVGGGGAAWLSWLSPIGWDQQVRPFADERWPVLLLLVAFAVATTVGAFALASRRDLGAGLLADRPGSGTASAGLSSPLGLSWRLQRGTFVAWLVALLLGGAIVGSIASQVGGMLNSPQAKDLITKLGGTQGLTDAYLALELAAFGSIISIFGMQTAMRLRSEEVGLRAEAVLSTAVGRVRWLAGYATVALAGTAALILMAGAASGAGHAAQIGDASQIGRLIGDAAVQIPAAFVMVGLVVAVFGLFPRFTTATWGVLVAFILLGEFGALFNLPHWVMNVSPFANVPQMPGGNVNVVSMVVLLAIAAALLAVGAFGFSRRDVG
jgi:ABC-2 type transport system permease protein